MNRPARSAATVWSMLCVWSAGCAPRDATGGRVLLDGLFGEWATAANVVDDPPDAPGSEVDVLSLQALDDPSWLYLALDAGNLVTLQSLRGTLRLAIDADSDRRTGGALHEMDGVDLVIELTPADSRGERGRGFGIRALGPEGASHEVGRHGLGLIAAPTWAAPRFEIRVSRLGGGGAPRLGERIRVKAAYTESGAVLDETEVGSYVFETRAGPLPPVDVGARLTRRPGTVRVAQWNVAHHRFSERTPDFAKVLAALEPDVILLDELPAETAAEDVTRLFGAAPLVSLGPWEHALGTTGGTQRALVATRLGALEPADSLVFLPYPEGALAALIASTDGATRELLQRQVPQGIPVAGAWIEIGGQAVLFLAADLQSGGWAGSPRDRLRILQAAAIRERVARELLRRPAPVVMGGDLNLVGSRTPLFEIARGLDVDGSDLLPVDAGRLGERTQATWRDPNDPFAPGRLDFLLIPDGAASVANSFVFATEDLDDDTLRRLGLSPDLMLSLSDHLVVVADLRMTP